MTLTITDFLMTSDATDHVAAGNAEGWGVSWWPGKRLDRNQAVTAMTLAELVGDDWKPEYMETAAGVLARTFAGELGLTAQVAVAMVLASSAEGTAPQNKETDMAEVACSTCGGSGSYTNESGKTVTCFACGGRGKVHETHQPKKK
jgi:hypothetical protein